MMGRVETKTARRSVWATRFGLLILIVPNDANGGCARLPTLQTVSIITAIIKPASRLRPPASLCTCHPIPVAVSSRMRVARAQLSSHQVRWPREFGHLAVDCGHGVLTPSFLRSLDEGDPLEVHRATAVSRVDERRAHRRRRCSAPGPCAVTGLWAERGGVGIQEYFLKQSHGGDADRAWHADCADPAVRGPPLTHPRLDACAVTGWWAERGGGGG
jgi:hypothetical protein